MSWTPAHEPGASINDFTADYVSARAFIKGADPYARIPLLANRYVGDAAGIAHFYGGRDVRNPHPPAYILLVAPLATLPYVTARNLWLIVMACSIVFAMTIVVRTTGAKPFTAAVVSVATLALPPVIAELKFGQVNALLLLAVVMGWQQLQRGRPILGGIAFGFASTVKLYPLFLLVPLIRSRNIKAALAQAGTATVATLGSAFLFGPSKMVRLATRIMPANTKQWLLSPPNLSLLAIPFRWLVASKWNGGAIDLPLLAYGVALILAVFCIVVALKTPARLSGDVFWAAIPWMLLLSPLSWYPYTIFALPLVYLVLLRYVRARTIPPWIMMVGLGFMLAWAHQTNVVWQALPTYGLLILGLSEWRRSLRTVGNRPGALISQPA